MMTHDKMIQIVQAQLAVDLNCAVADLNGDKDSVVFVEARENAGRRPFARKERHFDIVSMGQSIVVSATPERLAIARDQMRGQGRDAIFALPFVRGLYLHFLPDLARMQPLAPPAGYDFELVEREGVADLLGTPGFSNSLIYDPNHPYHTVKVMLARRDGVIVGMAGACDVAARLWQIGVDVLPGQRRLGLATYLVRCLTLELLNLGYVPSYDAIASNIASQRVAYRAGYYPAWVSDWRCNFTGLETPLPAGVGSQ